MDPLTCSMIAAALAAAYLTALALSGRNRAPENLNPAPQEEAVQQVFLRSVEEPIIRIQPQVVEPEFKPEDRKEEKEVKASEQEAEKPPEEGAERRELEEVSEEELEKIREEIRSLKNLLETAEDLKKELETLTTLLEPRKTN